MASWMAHIATGTQEMLPHTGDVWETAALPGSDTMVKVTRTDGSPRNPFEIADAQAAALSADGRTRSQAGLLSVWERWTKKSES
jgi:hypothetical protein